MKQKVAAAFRKIIFLTIVAVTPFLYTADELEQSNAIDSQDDPVEEQADSKDNVENDEMEEAESPLIFMPSENISEDFAVPYPVDI